MRVVRISGLRNQCRCAIVHVRAAGKRRNACGRRGLNPEPDPVTIPRGSYPTPFYRYLIFYITDPNHKARYPKQGVGHDPLGTAQAPDHYDLKPHPENFLCLTVREQYL